MWQTLTFSSDRKSLVFFYVSSFFVLFFVISHSATCLRVAAGALTSPCG